MTGSYWYLSGLQQYKPGQYRYDDTKRFNRYELAHYRNEHLKLRVEKEMTYCPASAKASATLRPMFQIEQGPKE